MNKHTTLIFILILVTAILQADENLSPEHKEWLELVSPIITKTEKEVFLKLQTKLERERFIQVFWRRHDPLPDTKENEFYKEYMERVRFADLHFGHGALKKGSRTERGHFYLLLGPPIERQMYATHSELWPLELWLYKGEQKYGLPPYFYLIFYQSRSLGEYRLYSPGVEGPEKLITPSAAARTLDRTSAFQVLKRISGELASASLSYLPSDTSIGMGSFSSATIISSILNLAEKKFSDAYARQYLGYKDYVETEYSHNYIGSQSKVKVFNMSGQFFVHWTMEPSQVNFSEYGDKYYASFELILRIEDSSGNLVLEKEEEIPLSVSPEDYQRHEGRIFALQDLVPIIPGDFTLFFLIKNKTTKDFTSFQKEISVPHAGRGPVLSNLLLYQKRERLAGSQKNRLKAFAFDGYQYSINTQNNFIPQKDIGLYCQVYGIEEKEGKSFSLEVFPANSEKPVLDFVKPLTEILSPDRRGIDSGLLPVTSLNPGFYAVEVSVRDQEGEKILDGKENFILLSQSYPVVPLVYSKLHNPYPNPDHLYLLASQYFMTGQHEKSKDLLERNLKIRDEPRSRLLLAKSLYALQKFGDSLSVVLPMYRITQDRESAKIIALDYAGLEDWTSALVYLERLMAQAVEVSVLNLASECYLNLNQPEKALPVIQKSLSLNPDQPKIRELEVETKKRLKQESPSG